jgi:hypothetical protein
MLTHFVRLIGWGLTKLALCSVAIYSLLIYFPGPPPNPSREDPCAYAHDHASCVASGLRFAEQIAHSWGSDRPWPLSYVAWLFDPSDTTYFEYKTDERWDIKYPTDNEISKGINITIGSIRIEGSGVLTGDFDTSINIDLGTPVSQVIGPGIGEMFTFLTTLITALMAVVVVQRWRRPQPYRVSTLPTSSALVDWWYLHSRRPIDAAVFRGQLA